ncbi:hypothetical protein TNCV_3373151 [Trichonephila clavipes]|nr:hypothetical protein TNCV_3373151 [Trichonephila clavipes]
MSGRCTPTDPKLGLRPCSRWSKKIILFRSLDIIGHWNAKRSSVPYLKYWALDVGWPAFEIVLPYWWTWKDTVGGANW